VSLRVVHKSRVRLRRKGEKAEGVASSIVPACILEKNVFNVL